MPPSPGHHWKRRHEQGAGQDCFLPHSDACDARLCLPVPSVRERVRSKHDARGASDWMECLYRGSRGNGLMLSAGMTSSFPVVTIHVTGRDPCDTLA